MSDPCMTRPCRRAIYRLYLTGSAPRTGRAWVQLNVHQRNSAVPLSQYSGCSQHRPDRKSTAHNLSDCLIPSPAHLSSLLFSFHASSHKTLHYKGRSSHRDRHCINGPVIHTGYSSLLKLQWARRSDGCTRCRHLPCPALPIAHIICQFSCILAVVLFILHCDKVITFS